MAPVPFLLAGPQDVVALSPGAVVGRQPAPGTPNAESTRVAHVELAEPDLPWRYSPQGNDPPGRGALARAGRRRDRPR